MRHTPEVFFLARVTPRADPKAVWCIQQREAGAFIQTVAFTWRGRAQIDMERRVQEAGMAGVDAAFGCLRPVAVLDTFGHIPMCVGYDIPLQVGKRGRIR